MAAQANNISAVISFTLETDGKLASGDTLEAAIETVERATGAAPAYYMVNCAHPTHFDDVCRSAMSAHRSLSGKAENICSL
jgi:S-methylmethionine-dependent homocysteine/selenocysteine methylase